MSYVSDEPQGSAPEINTKLRITHLNLNKLKKKLKRKKKNRKAWRMGKKNSEIKAIREKANSYGRQR